MENVFYDGSSLKLSLIQNAEHADHIKRFRFYCHCSCKSEICKATRLFFLWLVLGCECIVEVLRLPLRFKINRPSSLMSKNRGRTSGSLLEPDCNTFRAYCVVEHNPKLQNIANCSWYLLCLLKPYFVQYPVVCFLIKRMKVSFGLQLWNVMLHWVTGPAFV